jgi:hypothetical protein
MLAKLVISSDYKMKKKHKKLPPLEHLLSLFDYDPSTGGLYKKGAEPSELNALGSWTAQGYKLLYVKGYHQFLLHRIVYFMFHRKDPGQYVIDHINGDPADNRIKNLRRCRQTTNAKNLRKKGKYVVDDEGVGRWVSDVVKAV